MSSSTRPGTPRDSLAALAKSPLATVAGVVVGVAAIVGGLTVVPPNGVNDLPASNVGRYTPSASAAAPGTPAAPSQATSVVTQPSPSAAASSPDAAGAVTPTDAATSTTSSTSSTTSQAPTPDGSTSAPPGTVVTQLDQGSFTALFRWLPKAQYSAEQAVAYAEANRKAGYDVVAIDGDLVAKPGNWGVGVVGLADFNEATTVCRNMGFQTDGTNCFRRNVV